MQHLKNKTKNNPLARTDLKWKLGLLWVAWVMACAVTVPAGCWGRCTGSRWPQRPRGFSSLAARAGLLGSEVPWFELLHSGAGFFPEAIPQAGLCCTLDRGKSELRGASPSASRGWGHLLCLFCSLTATTVILLTLIISHGLTLEKCLALSNCLTSWVLRSTRWSNYRWA